MKNLHKIWVGAWSLALLLGLSSGCTKKDIDGLSGPSSGPAAVSFLPVAKLDEITGESYGSSDLACAGMTYYTWDSTHTCQAPDGTTVPSYVATIQCDENNKLFLTGDACAEGRTEVSAADVESFSYNQSIIGLKGHGFIFERLATPPDTRQPFVEMWANVLKANMRYDVVIRSPDASGVRSGMFYYQGKDTKGFVSLANVTRTDDISGRVYQALEFKLSLESGIIAGSGFKHKAFLDAVFFQSHYGFPMFAREFP